MKARFAKISDIYFKVMTTDEHKTIDKLYQ